MGLNEIDGRLVECSRNDSRGDTLLGANGDDVDATELDTSRSADCF